MRPIDEREFARVLAEASAEGTPVEIVGAGSKQRIGRPMQTAASLSARAMRGITLYEPSEMVMGARAGTPLTQIESDLADRGQMLAFEPVDLGPAGGRRGRTGHHRRRVRHQRLGCAAHRGRRGARPPAGGAGRQRPRRGVQVGRPGDEERHRLRPLPRPVRELGHAGGAERGDLQGAAVAGGHRHAHPARPARRVRGGGDVHRHGAARSRCPARCTCSSRWLRAWSMWACAC